MSGAGGAEQRSAGIAPTISSPLRGTTYRGFTTLVARDAASLKKRCGEPVKVYPVRGLSEPIELVTGGNPPAKMVPLPGAGCNVASEYYPEDAYRAGRSREVTLYGRMLQVDENYLG